jgi:hypothetical protein
MKQSVARVLLFVLIVSVFMVCTVSAMWSSSGNGLKNTEINRVTSVIQPSAATKPGTCSIVGDWSVYDPEMPWLNGVTTFNSDGTWSASDGESGTYTVVDPINGIYQFEASGIWTFTLSPDCSSFTATNDFQGRTLYGYRLIPPPVAAFDASPTTGFPPLTVRFTDKSTGDGISEEVWQYKLNSSSTWWTFYTWTPMIRDKSPTMIFSNNGVYDVKLTVTGTGGTAEELKPKLLKIGCDFSTQPDIERCFGGVGVNCEGTPGASVSFNLRTCMATGTMSIGSILHDTCCRRTDNAGYSCSGLNSGDPNLCRIEWQEAWDNTQCSVIGASRQWRVPFGPYPAGNTGDFGDVRRAILGAPKGTRVKPDYQELCISGKCTVNRKTGLTLLYSDSCGAYCVCA